jgi:Raf kinase inhibitor-like YbhB/YbcL family protein
MQLKSSAFRAGGPIPVRHTCDGENISPQFSWTNVPREALSLALLLHDPDAPQEGGFTHWVVYNMDSDLNEIEEGVLPRDRVAGLGMQGKNDSAKVGYMGPCPPSGKHRYFARLFALDTKLNVEPGATHQEVEAAMHGHILAQAALMGTYARQKAGHAA